MIDCPLLAKWEYSEDKIIIRNVPDCECYQSYITERVMADYCDKDEDICKYGNMWIINITNQQQSVINSGKDAISNLESEDYLLRAQRRKRSPEEIRACCNSCSRCAAAAGAICTCLSAGAGTIGGNWTMAGCTIACANFVEDFRRQCEDGCQNDFERPWENFETWKDKYEKKYRLCPKPPTRCP